MKRYNIICFKQDQTIDFYKNDLKTAFYVFRDCINSGLYNAIGFCVDDIRKHTTLTATPLIYKSGAVHSNAENKFYFTRFKSYLSKYGSSKNIIFKED